MSKISKQAFESQVRLWMRFSNKQGLMGKNLMRAFSVGREDPEIYFERDDNRAAELFEQRYVA